MEVIKQYKFKTGLNLLNNWEQYISNLDQKEKE